MNSPNFGNQQILLQSCCFFDSERSQTPHASNTIIKDLATKLVEADCDIAILGNI